ncbi:MAG: carboxypeptidase-like regulatory domain-containing protein [Tenacibaculum sp.]
MKKIQLIFYTLIIQCFKVAFLVVLLFIGSIANGQNTVKGVVLSADTEKPLQGVNISLQNTELSQTTSSDGSFNLQSFLSGKHFLEISLKDYETQIYPINLLGEVLDLGNILLYKDLSEDTDLSTITLTDDELNDDTGSADNISGLLYASRDVYLRTVAFEWSPSFYRIRGLDSENGKILINGIEMNKLYNGRPQWNNWGGINDVLRNQEFSHALSPSNYTFGGALGSLNINTRASEYRKGLKISYASSNRSYVHRAMASYTTGLLKNGWAFAISGSRRAGNKGFVDGTFYDANSFFASAEKQLNDKHSVNLTLIAAQNKRGKYSPNTQEVFDLKGIRYNPYWGYQNGKPRNSRVRNLLEPIAILSHFYDINENTSINTNLAFQTGKIGNSRISYTGARLVNNFPIGGGANPDPSYYQKLPSYALSRGTGDEYGLLQNFLNNGQLDWDEMIRQNIEGDESTNSKYILYEDRNDEQHLSVNTILYTELNKHITLNAKLQFRQIRSENFANVLDLLGGQGFLDVNTFGDTFNQKQRDLLNINRIVGVGDHFNYNYKLQSAIYNAFLQAQLKYKNADFFLAGNISKTSHQREGLYQNGNFPDNSLGNSKKLSFNNFSAKGGGTYKITGRHFLNFNAGYISKAPWLRNSFSNSRENNDVIIGLKSETISSLDASYILRSPILQAKLTGYYAEIKNATDISFFFFIGADQSAFVQEILTGVNKKHFGTEIGIEAKVSPTIKLKGAANIGQYTYSNNPLVYLTSETGVILPQTKSYLKNYKIASGPQKTYSLGFDYRNPDYWWVGTSVNFLDDIYVDIAPLNRTDSFVYDLDGLPFSDYDPEVARKILAQEAFDSYILVNAVGGKSWKIADYYIGFFVSINNLLNQKYKTGGYEQGRLGNYRSSKEDADLLTPVFGSKYWYGRGTTYFMNIYFRF